MGASEVAAGAAWLDENFPGWEREIDLGTLDIRRCDRCILGQSLQKFLYDSLYDRRGILTGFGYGLRIAEGQGAKNLGGWAMHHAFTDNLENEGRWRDLIKERFSTGNLSDND